jgi:hypothetical protein
MHFRRLLGIVISLFVTGCQAPPATASLPAIANGVRAGGATESRHMHLNKHMLVFITDSGELRYWPIDAKGGHISYPLGTVTGATSPTAMAANGDTVAIAFGNPSSVVLYDTATGTQRSLRVGRGAPTDVAYDNQGNIVVFDSYAEILVYRAPQFARKLVNCELVTVSGSYIAADREGDIFVNQESRGANEIVEIPKGSKGYESKKCSKLPIEEDGYNAGLAVDPKTDDLVVFYDPDLCAGGNEAEMDVYRKPYGQSAPTMRNLNGNCAYMLRFGPDARHVYFIDNGPTLSRRNGRPNDSDTHISQRNYPGGHSDSEYRDPLFAAGVATIPNELPN